jgi:hypothetical protein
MVVGTWVEDLDTVMELELRSLQNDQRFRRTFLCHFWKHDRLRYAHISTGMYSIVRQRECLQQLVRIFIFHET